MFRKCICKKKCKNNNWFEVGKFYLYESTGLYKEVYFNIDSSIHFLNGSMSDMPEYRFFPNRQYFNDYFIEMDEYRNLLIDKIIMSELNF